MKIDLGKERKRIRRYILQRIKDYPVYVNDGPGEDEAPIQLITLGYYLEQRGYFALVIDTRPDANCDGEWTLHIDNDTTVLNRSKWCALIDALYAGKQIEMVLPDGKPLQISQDTHTHEDVAQIIGEMLRDTMIELRDQGVFGELPLDENSFFVVEEFDGYWAWPKNSKITKQARLAPDTTNDELEVVEEESEDDRKEALVDRIKKLSVDEQISFWILELNRRATGKSSELDKVFLYPDFPYLAASLGNECAVDELGLIGMRSFIPMLELVRKLARYPEWDGDRPKRNFNESRVQDIAIETIGKVRDSGYRATDFGNKAEQIERLLHQIIRKACKTNEQRRLWGIIPNHAAMCLQRLFSGYPDPVCDDNTNRLKNSEMFQSRPN